ncbi:enoyl-CoA hydratase/isomerase family protein [Rhizobium sp. L1K21]|uniref:enoyl-CoA hydratase/isomerase family protein n=1 Tax=Rhizobium sp. L1K21 TaxID=2954933 RepID=UPI0020932B42|nr:enoyl-CoA hydratase/isomerase family protein [Rhizobium sp. L1K21]MCO6186134.1 enoyl-CoA hydratase/isomerase family protein [Rhizobium sp. L1K21]
MDTTSQTDAPLLSWQEGKAGRIRLNRPKALNALNAAMVGAIRTALDSWAEDDNVATVIIDAAGDKAFCAGGDIRFMYDTGREDPAPGRKFWRDEYCVNLLISRYPKPVVALIDGITMGGGVGLAGHASHRVVTERAVVAMPETSIGFLPDVGGTYLLSRAPGKTGLYLGTTSSRMNAADAIYANFADAFIPSERLPTLCERLADGADTDEAIAALSSSAPDGTLVQMRGEIDTTFDGATMLECLQNIERLAVSGDAWAIKTAAALRHNSPFSLAATFYALRQAENHDLEDCLKMEYRFSHRVLDHDDYYEGVRAVIVDKDRNPKWSPARLEDVDAAQVASMFADLGEDEWRFS